jgi:hypothetical protein
LLVVVSGSLIFAVKNYYRAVVKTLTRNQEVLTADGGANDPGSGNLDDKSITQELAVRGLFLTPGFNYEIRVKRYADGLTSDPYIKPI